MKQSFPPIADKKSKVLILGTMPGEQSLKLQQYYGHKGNHFWKLIFNLFEHPSTDDYGVKKQLLLSKGIALWDVLENCERKGSSDNTIANETANDFATFYKEHPDIQTVFMGSKKAADFYDKYVGCSAGKEYFILPSPSSANTWKTFDEKLTEWEIIKQYL